MKLENFVNQFNEHIEAEKPFLFLIDFEIKSPVLVPLNEASRQNIYYDIKGNRNFKPEKRTSTLILKSYSIEKQIFESKHNQVLKHLKNGDSYLLNLTFQTKININLALHEIFMIAQAPYKLFYKNKLVVFSPECFIRTDKNNIFTYPMKGTIDANIHNAQQLLLDNQKEQWEHNTIVDLMRNDLSMISNNVEVTKFRYINKIETHQGALLQTSSEICGKLDDNWQKHAGELLLKLLPAGSISGAPKQKTIEIIRTVEEKKRGYYTGIFGIFDGKNIDSAVCIRYIEKENENYYFRSGGGITAYSNTDDEYRELNQKIYVPIV